MKNTNASADEILKNILGAAILGAAVEQAEAEPAVSVELKRAQELRKQYDAFIEAGFDEMQATDFIIAILH